MIDAFEKKKSYLALKAHEGMIAFGEFTLHGFRDDQSIEGILKISCTKRPYRGDQLILTFIIDKEKSGAIDKDISSRFERITEESLKPSLGSEVERVFKIPIEQIAHMETWHMEEVSLFLRSLTGQKKTLVEKDLIPAIEKLLACSFQPIEWWPQQSENSRHRMEADEGLQYHGSSLKSILRYWLGMGKG